MKPLFHTFLHQLVDEEEHEVEVEEEKCGYWLGNDAMRTVRMYCLWKLMKGEVPEEEVGRGADWQVWHSCWGTSWCSSGTRGARGKYAPRETGICFQNHHLKGALTEIYLEVVEGVLCLEAQALQWVGEEVLAGEAVVEVAGLEAEVRVRLVYWVGVAVALLVPVSWI